MAARQITSRKNELSSLTHYLLKQSLVQNGNSHKICPIVLVALLRNHTSIELMAAS